MYSTLNVYLNIFYGKKVFRKLEREMVLPHHRIIKQDKIHPFSLWPECWHTYTICDLATLGSLLAVLCMNQRERESEEGERGKNAGLFEGHSNLHKWVPK